MEKETKKEYESRKWEELRLLNSWLLDDIRFNKNQQMMYLYYTIGLYSAILFLLSFLLPSYKILFVIKAALTAFCFVIGLIGIWFTHISQSAINRARQRNYKVDAQFTAEYNQVLDYGKGRFSTLKRSHYVYNVFILIQIIGGIFVITIIWLT
jgi:hypothetical protein